VRLLKALCQTDLEKTVCWHTKAQALEQEDVPRSFQTRSQVAILANDWFVSEDVQALEDRGHVVLFDPSPLEIHRNASKWFWYQQVFDLIADNLHLMVRHSVRVYVTAWERKQAGLPWQSAIFDRFLAGPAREVARLKTDPRFASEEERVRSFVAVKFGCRATFFNYARKLRPQQSVPRIELTATAPPRLAKPAENIIELLKRRHKGLAQG
jgi:hypothetical protein